MKRKALIALALATSLYGCSGVSNAGAAYLRDSAPYQQGLTTHQNTLRSISQLPSKERYPATVKLLEQVRSDRKALQAMKVPKTTQAVHQELDTLYGILEQYIDAASKSQGPGDAKLKKISEDWAKHLTALNTEVDRLNGAR